MLSLGVPFDSLQSSARFRIQDGSRNSGTQDYVVLAAHKIRLSINPNIIVNGFIWSEIFRVFHVPVFHSLWEPDSRPSIF